MANVPYLSHGIRYGFIFAALLLVVELSLYIISVDAYLSRAKFVFLVLWFLLAMLVSGWQLQRERLGQIRYLEALTCYFTTFIVLLTVKVLFSFVLINFVDPALNLFYVQQYDEWMIGYMEWIDYREKEIERYVDQSDSTRNIWNFRNTLTIGMLYSFFGFFVCSILGLVFKRNRRTSYLS